MRGSNNKVVLVLSWILCGRINFRLSQSQLLLSRQCTADACLQFIASAERSRFILIYVSRMTVAEIDGC